MAELCPYVNEVIVFETPFKSSTSNNDVINILMTTTDFSVKRLWRRHFDICFAFLNDPTHCFMSYMSGAKTRVALAGGFSNVLMTHPLPFDETKLIHWCERNLYLPQACGLTIKSKELELWIDNEDIVYAQNLLNGFAPNRIKIAFGLGANHVERRYPVEKYLVALKEIVAKGAAIIILGGPSERDEAKFLEDNLPKEFVKNLVEVRAGWRVDSAIISLCDMYLGNDTGTQHVAAALKKPIIVLSRESKDRERLSRHNCENIMFESWQTKHITIQPEHQLGECARKMSTCWAGKPHCIAQIEPEEIINAYEKILG